MKRFQLSWPDFERDVFAPARLRCKDHFLGVGTLQFKTGGQTRGGWRAHAVGGPTRRQPNFLYCLTATCFAFEAFGLDRG